MSCVDAGVNSPRLSQKRIHTITSSSSMGSVFQMNGEVVTASRTEDDELILHACDMDATALAKCTMFDLARRGIEHYALICARPARLHPRVTARPPGYGCRRGAAWRGASPP